MPGVACAADGRTNVSAGRFDPAVIAVASAKGGSKKFGQATDHVARHGAVHNTALFNCSSSKVRPMPRWPRQILFGDIDAMYASSAIVADPSLSGKLVAVGSPSLRGIITSASYPARR